MTSWRPQRLTGEQGGTCCWSQATSPTASRRGRKTAPKIEPLVPLPEQRQWLATTATGPQVTTLHARAADPQTRGVRLAQGSQPASACRRQGSDTELGRAWGCPSIFRARPINVSERCGLAHKKAHAVLKPQSDLQTMKRNCGARAGAGGAAGATPGCSLSHMRTREVTVVSGQTEVSKKRQEETQARATGSPSARHRHGLRAHGPFRGASSDHIPKAEQPEPITHTGVFCSEQGSIPGASERRTLPGAEFVGTGRGRRRTQTRPWTVAQATVPSGPTPRAGAGPMRGSPPSFFSPRDNYC